MPSDERKPPIETVNPQAGPDVEAILRENAWLAGDASEEQISWCARAATLLGPHAADRASLTDLLGLIFHYNAPDLLSQSDTHAVLARYAARDVLRELSLQLLDGEPLTTDRFRVVIDALKEKLEMKGRDLFHPLRLALAGRVGEGEMDRVALLLDEAATLSFAMPVKTARTRIVEFCSVLD